MQMELLLEADSSTRQQELSDGQKPDGVLPRTCRGYSVQIKGATLLQWLESYLGQSLTFQETDGELPVWHLDREDLSSGQYWMHSTSEWNPILAPSLKDEGVSSLSEILETGLVDRRYFLTPKACAGILRRAAKRGKELPAPLEAALRAVADTQLTLKRKAG